MNLKTNVSTWEPVFNKIESLSFDPARITNIAIEKQLRGAGESIKGQAALWFIHSKTGMKMSDIEEQRAFIIPIHQSISSLFESIENNVNAMIRQIHIDGYEQISIKNLPIAEEFNIRNYLLNQKEEILNIITVNALWKIPAGVSSAQNAVNELQKAINLLISGVKKYISALWACLIQLARKALYERAGFTEYEIDGEGDSKTCDVCTGMHGRIFKFEDFKVKTTAPPFHFNCRCSILPSDFPEINEMEADDFSFRDLLLSVMNPEQLEYLSVINDEILGMFTEAQKKRLKEGENISVILHELDPAKQERIVQLSKLVMDMLNREQKTDLLFLGSGTLGGIDLDRRLAILDCLKKNHGEITYDELVAIGVYKSEDLAEGGFKRWLQKMDFGGGPANFTRLLQAEYRLNNLDSSFARSVMEEKAKWTAQLSILFAMAAAPLISRAIYKSDGIVYDDNRFDNLERQGTRENFKGSVESWKSNEGAGSKIINSVDDVSYPQSSMDKAFTKHKGDFGNYPDGSNASKALFQNDVNSLLENGLQKSGTYRATPGIHVYNPTTRQWAFYNADGSFNTAFKLSPDQYKYLLETGVVK